MPTPSTENLWLRGDSATDALQLCKVWNCEPHELEGVADDADVARLRSCKCCGDVFLLYVHEGRVVDVDFCSIECYLEARRRG